MRAFSLFLALAAAKLIVLFGRDISWSGWSIVAFFWQDAAVALAYGVLCRFLRPPFLGWMIYGCVLGYAAINVPVARTLSSPLTLTMVRATGGALADSISHHLTLENLTSIAVVLGLGVVAPVILKRYNSSQQWLWVGSCGALIAVTGPIATARVETEGLHRNALVAIVKSAFPRVAPRSVVFDWRGAAVRPIEDSFARLRGSCANRNVVLVLLESTGAEYLGLYGGAPDPMPNLSALAEQALLFENAYAVYPESIKGLFSVLSSHYPALDTPAEAYEAFECPSLAHALAAAGYRTALFHSGRFIYLGMESIIRNRGFERLADAGPIGGNHQSSFGVDEPATVEHILAWIESLGATEKFFLTYLPVAGHHPYDTPEPRPFPGHDDQSRYRNALHYADAALGSLIEGLRSRGKFQETLFLIMGDHGEAFGQHEGNYGHTLFIYEENVRVPYVIAAPGLFSRQQRIETVASLMDAAPTVLDLLGLPKPNCFQGYSFVSHWTQRTLFYTDYSLGLLGLREGPWKYIYELESGRSKLFNLESDPRERINVARDELDRVARYRRHLLDWCAAQKHTVKAVTTAKRAARERWQSDRSTPSEAIQLSENRQTDNDPVRTP